VSWLREQKLIHLVTLLWNQLTPVQQRDIEPDVHAHGMDWALPLTDYRAEGETRLTAEDRLTTDEVARECGVTASTVRDWKKRHGLQQVSGYFRWGDIEEFLQERYRRQAERRAS
jgi:hypothetical protein